MRRAYPQLSVVTQAELSGLLIEHHDAHQAYANPVRAIIVYSLLLSFFSVAAPPADGEHEHKDVPATTKPAVDLTAAIATISQAQKAYSQSKLPPSFPTSYKRWRPQLAEDAPHDPNAYFPMILVK